MVTSPTSKGVVLLGGNSFRTSFFNFGEKSSLKTILELSGNSIESLEWNVLEQELMHPRVGHLAFSVSDEFQSNYINARHRWWEG